MKMKYVVCVKCRKEDRPRKPIFENGKIVSAHNVGTSVVMRCNDCGGDNHSKHALRCRDCCPTGHGTRFNEVETRVTPLRETKRMWNEKYGTKEDI